MRLPRRNLLAATALAAAPFAARAQATGATTDPRLSERGIGNPSAPVKVIEFFSLTCSHCAAFHKETYPRVKRDLVERGAIRLIWRDFPLDQVALTAAMVARHLPVDRYEPFVTALLANQDRWAFGRGINPTEELWKMAALAGMSRPTFDQAISDTSLRDWILQQQQKDQEQWKVDSTPSFVINGQKYAGDMSFDAFRKLIPA